MIKDKITPELKKRFIDELRTSKETGKERGFAICVDKKENIYASESCTGDHCSIDFGDLRKMCSNGIAQGDFHTHPYLTEAKIELARRDNEIPSDDKIINRMSNNIRKFHEEEGVKGITINSPSGDDLLYALLSKYIGQSRGTVCTISDIGDDKLECWTVKEMKKDEMDIYSAEAYHDISNKPKEQEGVLIEKWLDSIFDREIIELKKYTPRDDQ